MIYTTTFFLVIFPFQLSAYPGQDIKISIEAFDEFNKTSGAFIRVTDVS